MLVLKEILTMMVVLVLDNYDAQAFGGRQVKVLLLPSL